MKKLLATIKLLTSLTIIAGAPIVHSTELTNTSKETSDKHTIASGVFSKETFTIADASGYISPEHALMNFLFNRGIFPKVEVGDNIIVVHAPNIKERRGLVDSAMKYRIDPDPSASIYSLEPNPLVPDLYASRCFIVRDGLYKAYGIRYNKEEMVFSIDSVNTAIAKCIEFIMLPLVSFIQDPASEIRAQ